MPLPDNPVSSKPLRSMTAIIGSGVLTEVVKCAKEFLKFLVSLEEQCHSYLNTDDASKNCIKVMNIADLLFNLNYMIFPNNNVSIDQGFSTCGTYNLSGGMRQAIFLSDLYGYLPKNG